MAQVTDERALYLASFAAFEKSAPSNGSSWLAPLRKQAIMRFEELGFPTPRHEAWKYLNVAPITKVAFKHVAPHGGAPLKASQLERLQIQGLDAARLVFVDGHYSKELSHVDGLPEGAQLRDLGSALRDERDVIETHLAQLASYQGQAFVALNTAFIADGAFVHVPKGCVVERPLYVLYINTASAAPIVTHPRALILAEESSELTVIEDFTGVGTGEYFSNPVTEIVVGKNASVDYVKLGREGTNAYHIASMVVQQQRDSRFTSTSITIGGSIVRNDLHTVLDGEGASCQLNGLSMLRGEQVADDHTRIVHAKPHCSSDERYKAILDDRAQGVFNGEILVATDAQKSNSQQSSKNLLLSNQALMNTKPELKIFADDVKCAHGATIGQLDQDALFYLRSRGIGNDAARRILVHAFGSDIVSRIRVEPLRRALEAMLFPTTVSEGLMISESAGGESR